MSLAPYMINLFKNHIGRYSKQLAVKPKIKKNVKSKTSVTASKNANA